MNDVIGSIKECELYIKSSYPTLRKFMEDGGLPYTKLGPRSYKFSKAAISAWLNERNANRDYSEINVADLDAGRKSAEKLRGR